MSTQSHEESHSNTTLFLFLDFLDEEVIAEADSMNSCFTASISSWKMFLIFNNNSGCSARWPGVGLIESALISPG